MLSNPIKFTKSIKRTRLVNSKKLIIYELNEIPKKLLDFYISLRPNSNIAKLKIYGQFMETFTTDKGELHPWTTWSTFYRGVDSSLHKIKSLNQKIKEEHFPPIWKILIKEGVNIVSNIKSSIDVQK